MGNCVTDLKGGKQAVGVGDVLKPAPLNNNDGGGFGYKNDAVQMFYNEKGLQSLFMPLELSFSASKLLDMDWLSKSDPMAVVYATRMDGTLDEIGRTEVLMNTLDPAWINKIYIDYQFEIVQRLVFRIYDVDTKYYNVPDKELKLNEQDFLGEASCFLSEIVMKPSRSLTLKLQWKSGQTGMERLGTITIRAEETITSRQAVEIKFRATKLEDKDFFSKSDPFLRISRIVESRDPILICKTEVVKNNLNPTWKSISLTMQEYGSKDNPLLIECFDFENDGEHQLIGALQISVAGLEKLSKGKSGVNFQYPSVSRKNCMKTLKGQLFVDIYVEKPVYTFLDYISGGYELNFMVAVDFTASNGAPHEHTSLHYRDPSGRFNAYQQAISEVGEVIQFYDHDKRFPAWGFGGKTMDGMVSHCFNLNGSATSPEVEGVNGIMTAYGSALHSVALSGPTSFGQVINMAVQTAAQSVRQKERKYFVLLILTDGVVTDLQETIDALVKVPDYPLSIVIVGVGGADFKQMKILDADNGERLESSTGRATARDIVQFVSMREVYGGQITAVHSLLEELPTQFLAYMRSRNIKP